MSRILFCVVPERGHVNPCVGPALALKGSGHAVAFHAPGDIRPQLRAAGGFDCFGPTESPRPADWRRGAAFAAQVRDPAWLREWVRSLLIDNVDAEVERIRHSIRAWRPEVVVIDPLLYAAAIAADAEGLPWVAMSNSLNPVLPPSLDSDLLHTVRWLAPRREALFAAYGMVPAFRGCDVLSPWLTLAFATEAFVPDAPTDIALVGPSLPAGARGDETDFPWDRLDPALPLVYMSLGSQIYHQPAMFAAVIEGLRDQRVQLVMSIADLLDTDELPALGERMLAVRYTPQLAMLERASLFITHGGANSVMEALSYGVPMIVSPLCNDQFHQAHFVEAAGVGRRLDLCDASPVEVATTITDLLGSAEVEANLARVARSYCRSGADEAARRISELAAGSRRVTRS
jgi:UDP:flavonoid glycosyltransferase YjiC (YdhE family)